MGDYRERPQARRRQLRASSDGSSDATSKASFPLRNTEARQHQGNVDVTSDVVLSYRCCPSAGAEIRPLIAHLDGSRWVISTGAFGVKKG